MEIDRNKYLALTNETYFDCLGRVTKVVGLTIESVGPDAKLNDLCRIFVGGPFAGCHGTGGWIS